MTSVSKGTSETEYRNPQIFSHQGADQGFLNFGRTESNFVRAEEGALWRAEPVVWTAPCMQKTHKQARESVAHMGSAAQCVAEERGEPLCLAGGNLLSLGGVSCGEFLVDAVDARFPDEVAVVDELAA